MRTRAAGLFLVATIATLGACSNGGATAGPTTGATAQAPGATAAAATQAAATAPGGSAPVSGSLADFCQTFPTKVVTAWPPKDAAAAFDIGPYFRDWAANAELATVATDLTTVFNWLAVASIMTTPQAPTADVTAAYGRVATFAASHC